MQRPAYFIHFKYFFMHNQKSKKPTRTELAQIKAELLALNPHFRKLKVKPYFRIASAYASIGRRRVHVRGNVHNIVERFTQQYLERLPTAFE